MTKTQIHITLKELCNKTYIPAVTGIKSIGRTSPMTSRLSRDHPKRSVDPIGIARNSI